MNLQISNIVKHFFLSSDEYDTFDAGNWQRIIFHYLTLTLFVLGLLAYIPSVLLAIREDLWPIVYVDTLVNMIIVIVFFYRKMHFTNRAKIVLVMMFALGVFLIVTTGTKGAGFIWLFVFPVIAAVFLPFKIAISGLILNFLTLFTLALFIYLGKPNEIGFLSISLNEWIVIASNFILLNTLTVIPVAEIIRRYKRQIENEKLLRVELSEQQQKLLEAERIAKKVNQLKTEFLSNISHELRTPLNIIIGNADLARFSERGSPEWEAHFQNIHRGSEELINFIENIISISTRNTEKMLPEKINFNVNLVLYEIQAMYLSKNELRNKAIELNLVDNFIETNVTLKSDPEKLRQIFEQLIDNAIKFAPDSKIEFGIKNISKGEIAFFVKDFGPGIPNWVSSEVFNKFWKMSPESDKLYQGMGLGLSIAYDLTELLGGNIWLDKENDQGCQFIFTIPQNEYISADSVNKTIVCELNK